MTTITNTNAATSAITTVNTPNTTLTLNAVNELGMLMAEYPNLDTEIIEDIFNAGRNNGYDEGYEEGRIDENYELSCA